MKTHKIVDGRSKKLFPSMKMPKNMDGNYFFSNFIQSNMVI